MCICMHLYLHLYPNLCIYTHVYVYIYKPPLRRPPRKDVGETMVTRVSPKGAKATTLYEIAGSPSVRRFALALSEDDMGVSTNRGPQK